MISQNLLVVDEPNVLVLAIVGTVLELVEVTIAAEIEFLSKR